MFAARSFPRPQFSLGHLLLAMTVTGIVLGLPRLIPNLSLIFTAMILSVLNVLQVAHTTPLRACVPGIIGWIAGCVLGGLAIGILDPLGVRYYLADPALIALVCLLVGAGTSPLGAALGLATGMVQDEFISQSHVIAWLNRHRYPKHLRASK